MTMITKAEFAARVRELRNRRKLTQDALARAAELSPDTIRRLEGGTLNPSLDTINKVAAGLGVEAPYLMAESYDESDDLAMLIRNLPTTERAVASSVLGALFVHAAGL